MLINVTSTDQTIYNNNNNNNNIYIAQINMLLYNDQFISLLVMGGFCNCGGQGRGHLQRWGGGRGDGLPEEF